MKKRREQVPDIFIKLSDGWGKGHVIKGRVMKTLKDILKKCDESAAVYIETALMEWLKDKYC